MRRLTLRLSVAAVTCLAAVSGAGAQGAGAAASATDTPLFAVEIKVGPQWDPARPPQEQALFREHSANLRRMRDAGAIVMGARYADKGLVVVSAPSAGEVKAMLDQDPSFAAGTFVYEIHPFSVFYAGELKARRR